MTCRILFLVGQLGLGGLERQLTYLLQRIDKNRYQPAVAIWNYNKQDPFVQKISEFGVPLHPLPNNLGGVAKLKAFRDLVRGWSPEVVHSYSFYTNFAVWWAALGLDVIPIGSIRSDFVTERRAAGRVLGRLSGCLPSSQIANSLAAKKNAEQFYWFSRPSEIFTVRNGLDIDQFSIHPIPEDQTLLLAVGSLVPDKRWDRLLRSVADVAETGLHFSVSLVGEGPLRKVLESQVKDLGLETLVQFLGSQRDIPALLKESTFLVHTADTEGCPNIVMEAMACGRAVVSTDAGDIPYLVDDGKTGFVVRRGDDRILAERMTCLMRDHRLCQRMGKAGRAKAKREFSIDRLVFETLDAYRSAGFQDA